MGGKMIEPDVQQQVLDLRFFGKSYRKIATALGICRGSVLTICKRGTIINGRREPQDPLQPPQLPRDDTTAPYIPTLEEIEREMARFRARKLERMRNQGRSKRNGESV